MFGRHQPVALLRPEDRCPDGAGAVASGPEAIGTWRRVEAALAAQAPTVPLANAKDTALVAERVGNYQHHPLWGPLLDQLWVK